MVSLHIARDENVGHSQLPVRQLVFKPCKLSSDGPLGLKSERYIDAWY